MIRHPIISVLIVILILAILPATGYTEAVTYEDLRDQAINDLNSSDDSIRFEALYMLRQIDGEPEYVNLKIPPGGVTPIITGQNGDDVDLVMETIYAIILNLDESTDIRLAAIRAVDDILYKDEEFEQMLVQLLDDPDPYVMALAIQMNRLSEDTMPIFLSALNDEHAAVREAAALAFSRERYFFPTREFVGFYDEAIPILKSLLKDREKPVRYAAAIALARRDPESDDHVSAFLESLRKGNHIYTIINITWDGGKATDAALPLLLNMLENGNREPTTEEIVHSYDTKENNIQVLAGSTSISATYLNVPKYLRDIDLMDKLQEMHPDSFLYKTLLDIEPTSIDLAGEESSFFNALIIVHRADAPYVELPLWNYKDENLLAHTASGLGMTSKGSEVVDALMVALGNNSSYVAGDAARALAMIGPEASAALPRIIELINEIEMSEDFSDDINLKLFIQSLGGFGPDSADLVLPVIEKYLDDTWHRDYALYAICDLGTAARELEPRLMEMVYDPEMQSDQWLIANCLIYFWWEDDDLIEKTTTMYWQFEERSRESLLSTIAYIGEAALPLLEDIVANDESKSIQRNAKDWIRYVKHSKVG